jgi:hypothetical protein
MKACNVSTLAIFGVGNDEGKTGLSFHGKASCLHSSRNFLPPGIRCPALVSSGLPGIIVECAVCRGMGTYDLPASSSREADLENWAPLPCFFTPECIGHVWPEAPN